MRYPVLVSLAFVLLAACNEPPEPITIEPSFNSVLRSGEDIITRTRPDEAGAAWSSYTHEDWDYPNCVDMEVAPNAGQRFLSYIDVEDGNWRLAVRSGLGNSIWAGEEITLPIVDLEFPTCANIYHLRDDLYGILWIDDDGTLRSALFAPNNVEGLELIEGETVTGFEFDSVQRISLAYYDGEVFMVWTTADGDRIRTMRGQVTDSSLTFSGIATFSDVMLTSHSVVVAGDDGLYMTAADGDAVRLLRTGGSGTDWAPVESCVSTRQVSSKLLYADSNGEWKTLLSGTSITNERMLDIASCETAVFQVPIARGFRIIYSPGS